MKIGDRVRVVKDTVTPSHLGREGRVVKIRRNILRAIRVDLQVGRVTVGLNYAPDELEVIKH